MVFELRDFAVPGVYALINPMGKRVDVRHSGNCLEAVVRHLVQIWDGTHPCKRLIEDREDLHVVLLEKIEFLQYRMMAHSYYLNKHQEMGYEFYRFRPAANYRVRIVVEEYKAVVRLQNSNHDSFVVGVFSSMHDAQSFVSTYYTKKVPFPVYACNEETKRYLCR
jgi:hypothetical protein